MKNVNTFYTSPGKGGQGKCSGRDKFYMSPGSGGQGKVGPKKTKFMKGGTTSTKTTSA